MAIEEMTEESDLEIEADEKVVKSKIPNGGLIAWLQVLGSFLLFFNSW